MSVVLDKVTEIQDQVIDYLGSVKEPVVSGVEAVVGFVMDKLPEVPAVPFADKLVKAASPLTNKILDRKTVKAAAKKVAPKAAAKAA